MNNDAMWDAHTGKPLAAKCPNGHKIEIRPPRDSIYFIDPVNFIMFCECGAQIEFFEISEESFPALNF